MLIGESWQHKTIAPTNGNDMQGEEGVFVVVRKPGLNASYVGGIYEGFTVDYFTVCVYECLPWTAPYLPQCHYHSLLVYISTNSQQFTTQCCALGRTRAISARYIRN